MSVALALMRKTRTSTGRAAKSLLRKAESKVSVVLRRGRGAQSTSKVRWIQWDAAQLGPHAQIVEFISNQVRCTIYGYEHVQT